MNVDLPDRFSRYRNRLKDVDPEVVNEILKALSDARDRHSAVVAISKAQWDTISELQAENERLNKNCPLSNMPHGHYVYCHTCEKDIPVTPQRLKGE